MKLNDTFLRSLKSTGAVQKHADGGGLYLYISATGGKLWRMDYRFAGKRKTLSFGAYPAVSLKDARVKREETKEQLAKGIDPGAHKQAVKAAILAKHENGYEVIAREWFEKYSAGWSESNKVKVFARQVNYIFPFLDSKPISEITAT